MTAEVFTDFPKRDSRMQCPRCQHENPSGVKFCGECEARLELLCPTCGAANPPGNKFCGECGAVLLQTSPEAYTPKHLAEKILTLKSAFEGERKQVTVLFADMRARWSCSPTEIQKKRANVSTP